MQDAGIYLNIKHFLTALFQFILDRLLRFISFPENKHEVKSILFIKLGLIGDYILFRNFIYEVKENKKYQDHKFYLCGNKVFQKLAETYDREIVDEFFWLDRKKFIWSIPYQVKFINKIRKIRYSTVLHPTFSRDFFWGDRVVKNVNADLKVGFQTNLYLLTKWQKFISDRYYDQLVQTQQNLPFEFNRQKVFFESFFKKEILAKKPLINSEKLDVSLDYLPEDPFILIAPGAGRDFRRWSEKKFIELGNKLLSGYQYKIILTGSPDEKKITNAIYRGIDKPGIYDLAGKANLEDMPVIINRSILCIANETSIVHMAAAVGASCICVSNGNHYQRFHPYPKEMNLNVIHIYPETFESDINKDVKLGEKYYYQRSDYDINSISVDRVYRNVLKLINNNT